MRTWVWIPRTYVKGKHTAWAPVIPTRLWGVGRWRQAVPWEPLSQLARSMSRKQGAPALSRRKASPDTLLVLWPPCIGYGTRSHTYIWMHVYTHTHTPPSSLFLGIPSPRVSVCCRSIYTQPILINIYVVFTELKSFCTFLSDLRYFYLSTFLIWPLHKEVIIIP